MPTKPVPLEAPHPDDPGKPQPIPPEMPNTTEPEIVPPMPPQHPPGPPQPVA